MDRAQPFLLRRLVVRDRCEHTPFFWGSDKPLRKVLYKWTFGMPDQGQTLDVWGDIQQISTLRWRWHSYVEKSPPQPGIKSLTDKDIIGGISATILVHTDWNKRSFQSNANPVRGIWCGFFLSWQGVPTLNARVDTWDRVESYRIHMFLAHRLKITFTSNLKLIISFFVQLQHHLFFTSNSQSWHTSSSSVLYL